MTLYADLSDAGKRIDVFISEKTEYTRARVQKLLEDGCVFVGEKAAIKSYKVCEGDEISFECAPPRELKAEAENIPIDIVYEDGDIVVVNKPKGLVVHPAAGNENGTLVNALLYHCGGTLSGIGGVLRPGIVHRIDKDTSGLLVVAKNDAAHLSLSEQIKRHDVSRVYYAVALGGINSEMTLDYPIGRHPVDRKKMAVTAKNSKPAVTHVYPIESFHGATFVRCVLETGRTHQIRVHLSHIGHPIIGDEVYGGVKNQAAQKCEKYLFGQCLHAGEISFVHPRTGENMHFECPLPDYFEKVLEILRGIN
ncbi:MAG: RluA family pseudouridine synthase [Clostridiales bacterium]|nr:RluA family pseudouridine synthase [Clostridiales bacterium]